MIKQVLDTVKKIQVFKIKSNLFQSFWDLPSGLLLCWWDPKRTGYSQVGGEGISAYECWVKAPLSNCAAFLLHAKASPGGSQKGEVQGFVSTVPTKTMSHQMTKKHIIMFLLWFLLGNILTSQKNFKYKSKKEFPRGWLYLAQRVKFIIEDAI